MTKAPRNPKPTLTVASSNTPEDVTLTTPVKQAASKPMSKASESALPETTFSPELLSKILNELTETKKQLTGLMAERQAKPSVSTGDKINLSDKNDKDCIRIFKKAGFKEPLTPRVNILTFRKWVENGYRPVEKSKALKVNNLRLWHVSQVRPLTKAEIKAAKDQSKAADLRREGSPILELQ
jgi:hypothetical protein